MERATRAGLRRAATGTAAITILACLPALAPAADRPDRSDRRSYEASAPMPTSPLGDRPLHGVRDGIRIAPRALLAGRPGQTLRVRVRVPRGVPAARLTAELRAVGARDPRRPGRTLPTGVVAGPEPATRSGARRAVFRLEGISAAPGPLRLIVRSGGFRLRGRTVRVLPQTLAGEPSRAGRGVRPRPGRAQRPSLRAGSAGRLSLAAGELNHDLSFEAGSQAGAAVAVEGDDPSRGIAVTGDGAAPPIAFVTNQAFSAGGVARRALPTTAALPGGGSARLAVCCDPAVAADSDGNLWMAARAGVGSPAGERIVIDRVPPAGTGFGATATALPVAAGSFSQSKPALAVAAGERIAAGWVETLGGVQHVVVSECDISSATSNCDSPDSWSEPAPVTETGGLVSMPDLDYAPDGDLYAVWWDARPPPGGNRIAIDRCREGEACSSAASWDEDATVAGLDALDDDGVGGLDPLPLFCPMIGAPAGLVNPAPSVEVGPGGEVYVAYADLRDNPDPANPTRCTASGSDKTWESLVAVSPAPDSFPTPDSGVRISADGPLDLNDHFLPALTVDPSSGEVEVSFHTTADDPSGQRAARVLAASSDGGASYSAPIAISSATSRFAGTLTDGFDYGDRQGADSALGVHRAAWTDNRPLQGRDADLYVLSPPVETTITSAPSGEVATATNTVRFSTPAPRAVCSINGSGFNQCRSPLTIGPVANGPQSVAVAATDAAGNLMDRTAARATWSVVDRDPPETSLTRVPKEETKAKRPEFAFASDESPQKFQCRYDKDEWRVCLSPKSQKVGIGRHRFRVRAFDLAGNVDPTPAKYRFERLRRCGKKKRAKGRCGSSARRCGAQEKKRGGSRGCGPRGERGQRRSST